MQYTHDFEKVNKLKCIQKRVLQNLLRDMIFKTIELCQKHAFRIRKARYNCLTRVQMSMR